MNTCVFMNYAIDGAATAAGNDFGYQGVSILERNRTPNTI
jgi:hypothetical protein